MSLSIIHYQLSIPTMLRRQFIQNSAILVAASLTGYAFDAKKHGELLSFSTLGCPDWSFPQIVDFAVKHGYKGIEIRGIQRQMDLPLCPEFSKEKIAETISLMKSSDLQFVNLGSSCNLHFADAAAREKNLDEARRFIDLAQQINCPFIRVFPNNFPKDQEKQQTMELIAKGLTVLGDYAKGGNVTVLMETHGELVYTNDLVTIMHAAGSKHIGLIWDITNMWTITKEPPADVYAKLKKYIRHTHIKDAKLVDGKLQYTLLGHGEVPIFDAIELLKKDGYKGFYSFEWEKLWHPELAEPEIAIADYARVMKKS
ncbi:TIM barrel protein [soil metagenome]